MNIKSSITHEKTYHTTLEEGALKRLLAEVVSEKVGLDLALKGVEYKVRFETRDSSTGFSTTAHVTLTKTLKEGDEK